MLSIASLLKKEFSTQQKIIKHDRAKIRAGLVLGKYVFLVVYFEDSSQMMNLSSTREWDIRSCSWFVLS